MSTWSRIGRTSPVDVRDVPGGHAIVSRREGGRWQGTLVVHVEAGDDTIARAKIDALAQLLTAPPVLGDAPDGT